MRALRLDAALECLPQVRSHSSRRIVPGGAVGLRDDGAEITDRDVIGDIECRSCAVEPVGLTRAREQFVGHGQERTGRNLTLALGLQLCVLIDDRLAHGRDTAAEQLLGHGMLLRSDVGEKCVAVLPTWGEPLRFGPGIGDWAVGPGTDRTIGAVRAVCTIDGIGTRTTRRPLRGRASRSIAIPTGTVGPGTAIGTIAAAWPLGPRSTALAITATSGLVGVGDVDARAGRARRGADDFKTLAVETTRLGRHDGHDAGALELTLRFCTDDIADASPLVEHSGVERAFRLSGPGSAPGPDAVVGAREFDVDAVRHTAKDATR